LTRPKKVYFRFGIFYVTTNIGAIYAILVYLHFEDLGKLSIIAAVAYLWSCLVLFGVRMIARNKKFFLIPEEDMFMITNRMITLLPLYVILDH